VALTNCSRRTLLQTLAAGSRRQSAQQPQPVNFGQWLKVVDVLSGMGINTCSMTSHLFVQHGAPSLSHIHMDWTCMPGPGSILRFRCAFHPQPLTRDASPRRNWHPVMGIHAGTSLGASQGSSMLRCPNLDSRYRR